MNEQLDRIEKQLAEISGQLHRALHGNNGTPGIYIRLDRMEQSEQRRVWHMRALWGAVVAAIGQSVAQWFGK